MSHVTFHSGKKTALVHGCEYHYAWALVDKLSAAFEALDGNKKDASSDNARVNRVISLGSSELRFLTLFAGLADPFLWVKAGDRDWLAGIIERGLANGILRIGSENGKPVSLGWEEVISLLRERADIPVATSYSGNYGTATSILQRGNGKKIAELLAINDDRRIGPDNIDILRFRV